MHLLPPKTECGCPSGRGIKNGHIRHPSHGGTQKERKKKLNLCNVDPLVSVPFQATNAKFGLFRELFCFLVCFFARVFVCLFSFPDVRIGHTHNTPSREIVDLYPQGKEKPRSGFNWKSSIYTEKGKKNPDPDLTGNRRSILRRERKTQIRI